jgi:hypothetical protein
VEYEEVGDGQVLSRGCAAACGLGNGTSRAGEGEVVETGVVSSSMILLAAYGTQSQTEWTRGGVDQIRCRLCPNTQQWQSNSFVLN